MSGEAPPHQLVRVQRMAAILAATVSGDETALAVLRAGESPYSFLPPAQRTSPAPKESIDALPKTTVTEADAIKDCAICLENMGVGAQVKSMPCEHGFHSGCIETWLLRRDTCPVCRYKMGVVEVDVVVDLESGGVGDLDPDDSGDDGYEYHRVEYSD